MDGDDDGRRFGECGEVCGEPLELVCVDAALVGMIVGDADGIEHDEVVPLVVEKVENVCRSPVFKELLAVHQISGAIPLAG